MTLSCRPIALLTLAGFCAATCQVFAAEEFDKAAKAAAQAEAKNEQCHVSCVEPHAACVESQKVIDTLYEMAKLISKGDLEHFGEYFDENVTTFDEVTRELLVGKKAVLARIKERYEQSVKAADGHMVSYIIMQPYAKVTGDRATVTCLLRKTLGGKHPVVYESHDTKVFIKEGDKWKEFHSAGIWKKVSS
jgi:hypothetical protein